MKIEKRSENAAIAARIILGLVLLVSGFLKLLEPTAHFAAALEAYHLVPEKFLFTVARAFPWVELFAGGFLVFGYWIRWSAAAGGLLACSFFLAVGSTFLRGIKIGECGCFGSAGPHLAPWQTMVLDAALISLAHFVFTHARQPWSFDAWIAKGK